MRRRAEVRFCRDHEIYYMTNVSNIESHLECKNTHELTWPEVLYYLNKFHKARKLRQEYVREMS